MAANTLIDAPRSAGGGTNGGSRPVLGATLAGLGALLFVIGGLVHFYVVPTLAVAPIDQNSVTSLVAKDATVFDTATLKPITTDLSVQARTVGDVAASKKAPGDAVVWVNTTTVTSSDGVIRSQSVKRAAFDETTAEAVNCCDNFMETEQGVRQKVTRSGLMFKFPFYAEKKSYQVWDDTIAKPVTTTYKGTAKVQGHKTWIFTNDVPATVVGKQDVPGSLVGQASNDNVSADSYYQNHNTYYVEPITGAIVNQVTETKSWFSYQGTDLVTTEARIAYTPKETSETYDLLGARPALLGLAHGFLPWVVALVGLGLIGLGGALGRRQAG
ncbi:hypothetical protein ACVW00_002400 [Marmoricola sp. URHA0025 HA25]